MVYYTELKNKKLLFKARESEIVTSVSVSVAGMLVTTNYAFFAVRDIWFLYSEENVDLSVLKRLVRCGFRRLRPKFFYLHVF
jgi:hypothetical protein